jgi:hypothetical protein
MRTRWQIGKVLTWSLALFFVTGCGDGELAGDYWTVDVVGIEDDCSGQSPDYSESFDYRMVLDGGSAGLYIGADLLANGILTGCTLDYQAAAWSEARGDFEVRWLLSGSATVNRNDGCATDGTDWVGTETIEVVASDDPSIEVGCTYVMDVSGTYVGEVE